MRSDSTIESYQHRAGLIIIRILREGPVKTLENLDLRSLPIWLSKKQKGWSKNTFRQYKSALRWYLETIQSEEALEALEMLYELNSTASLKKGTRTSALKPKRFSTEDLFTYDQWLVNHPEQKWSALVRSWLWVGALTGVRPVEWQHAELLNVDDEPGLRVVNAKQSGGRALGYDRILLLGELQPEYLVALERHIYLIERAIQSAGSYAHLYKKLRDFVYSTTRRCWRKRIRYPTLYDLRHQFVANLKRAELAPAEIAALVGHATDETAQRHYGRKAVGEPVLGRISPLPERVARVRKKNKSRPSFPTQNTSDQCGSESMRPSK